MLLLPALGVGDPQEGRGDIAFSPSFGPPVEEGVREAFLILLPTLRVGDPRERRGGKPFPPSFAPPRRQG